MSHGSTLFVQLCNGLIFGLSHMHIRVVTPKQQELLQRGCCTLQCSKMLLKHLRKIEPDSNFLQQLLQQVSQRFLPQQECSGMLPCETCCTENFIVYYTAFNRSLKTAVINSIFYWKSNVTSPRILDRFLRPLFYLLFQSSQFNLPRNTNW